MNVHWYMSKADTWLRLKDANLGSIDIEGVYGIWMPASSLTGPIWIRVGQGVVADRIACHREDAEVTQYENGDLRFTYAEVPVHQRDGVELYLAQKLGPIVGARFPQCVPIPVNLPLVA